MEFNNLSEKIQKLVIDKNYDILRDKALVLQEKSIDACRGDEDYDIPCSCEAQEFQPGLVLLFCDGKYIFTGISRGPDL